jgi:hypothetical protein
LRSLDWQELFFAHVRLFGGPAPVRRFLPELIDLVLNRKINPGMVFDLTDTCMMQANGGCHAEVDRWNEDFR